MAGFFDDINPAWFWVPPLAMIPIFGKLAKGAYGRGGGGDAGDIWKSVGIGAGSGAGLLGGIMGAGLFGGAAAGPTAGATGGSTQAGLVNPALLGGGELGPMAGPFANAAEALPGAVSPSSLWQPAATGSYAGPFDTAQAAAARVASMEAAASGEFGETVAGELDAAESDAAESDAFYDELRKLVGQGLKGVGKAQREQAMLDYAAADRNRAMNTMRYGFAGLYDYPLENLRSLSRLAAGGR